jgi:hypothetical protein
MMPPAWPQRISDRILLANRAQPGPKLGERLHQPYAIGRGHECFVDLDKWGHIHALSLGRLSRRIAVVIFLVPAAVARAGAA